MDIRMEQTQDNAQPCSVAKCQSECTYHQTNALRLESELKAAQMRLKNLQDWIRTKFGEDPPLPNIFAEGEGQILGNIPETRSTTCSTSNSSGVAEVSRMNWSIEVTSPFSNSVAAEDGSENEVKSEADDEVDSYFEEGSIILPVSDSEYCLSESTDAEAPTPTVFAISTGDIHFASDTRRCLRTRQLRAGRKFQSGSNSHSGPLSEFGEMQCGTCQKEFPSLVELSKHSIRHAIIILSRCDHVPENNRLTRVLKKRKRIETEIVTLTTNSVSGKKWKMDLQKPAPMTKKSTPKSQRSKANRIPSTHKSKQSLRDDDDEDNCTTLNRKSLRNKDIERIAKGISSQIKLKLIESQTVVVVPCTEEESAQDQVEDDVETDPDIFPTNSASPNHQSSSEDENESTDSDSDTDSSEASVNSNVSRRPDPVEETTEAQLQTRREEELRCTVCKTQFDTKVGLLLHTLDHSKINVVTPISVAEPKSSNSVLENTLEKVGESEYAGENPADPIQRPEAVSSTGIPNPDLAIRDADDQCDTEVSDAEEDEDRRKSKKKKKRHPKQGQLNCEHCDKQFNDAYYYKNHLLTHEGKSDFKCLPCNKQFSSKSNLVAHNRHIHEGVVNFMCDICDKPFFTKQNLTYHKAKHSTEKPVKCTHEGCTKTFKHNGLLATHLRASHSEECEKTACDVCGKLMKRQYLSNHIKNAHPSSTERHSCPTCNKSYAWKVSLIAHMKNHHEESTAGSDKDSGETNTEGNSRGFPCHICGKSLSRPYILRDHLKTHGNVKDLPCKVCSETFRTPAALKAHVRVLHEGEQHKCLICEKVFTLKFLLREHLITAHFDVPLHLPQTSKMVKCSKCPRTFQTKVSLRVHKTKVHGKKELKRESMEGKYKCKLCPSSYKLKGFLHSHAKVVHSNAKVAGPGKEEPVKRTQCEECGKDFKKRSSLRRHEAQVHSGTFPCPHCSKHCRDARQLKLHLVGKHPESLT